MPSRFCIAQIVTPQKTEGEKMDFTEQRNKLLAQIEDGIPPSVHLLSHVSDLIRDCLNAHLTSVGPMRPTQVQLVFDHISAAWDNARKILDSPKKVCGDPFLAFLTELRENHFVLDPLPSINELEALYDKTMVFIATHT